jgi:polar amino acid transport system substrate-binding protein
VTGATEASEGLRSQIAPSGRIRLGVVEAPAVTTFFVERVPDGEPRGVTVDLGRALGQHLGLPVEFVVYPNSGQCTKELAAGEIDVGFMPVDDERRKILDFGPAYFLAESTYLVAPGSDIGSLEEVDRPGVRVIGIANTTTIRAAARTLQNTVPQPADSVGEAVEMIRTGKADALALGRDSFKPILPGLPGARVLDGAFQAPGVCIAVPKGRPQALAAVTAFMEEAKRSGLVRRALDAVGFAEAEVAPAGTVTPAPPPAAAPSASS